MDSVRIPVRNLVRVDDSGSDSELFFSRGLRPLPSKRKCGAKMFVRYEPDFNPVFCVCQELVCGGVGTRLGSALKRGKTLVLRFGTVSWILSGYTGPHYPLRPVIGLGLPNQRKKERKKCVSEVIELLAVWWHNKPKTKNQKNMSATARSMKDETRNAELNGN